MGSSICEDSLHVPPSHAPLRPQRLEVEEGGGGREAPPPTSPPPQAPHQPPAQGQDHPPPESSCVGRRRTSLTYFLLRCRRDLLWPDPAAFFSFAGSRPSREPHPTCRLPPYKLAYFFPPPRFTQSCRPTATKAGSCRRNATKAGSCRRNATAAKNCITTSIANSVNRTESSVKRSENHLFYISF